MADDKKGAPKKGEAPAKEAPKGSLMGKLGLYLGVAVVAAGLAVAVFLFVLKPKLSAEPGAEGKTSEAKKGGKEAEEKVTSFQFEPAMATVLMSDPAMPASLLMYQVSMECANEKTAAMVKEHKSKLASMLADLHSFRRREELNEPQTKKSIEKVALQKANDILQTYLEKPDPKIKIIEIFHESFVVEDK
jgi:flagellar basal body-associated protein FliL